MDIIIERYHKTSPNEDSSEIMKDSHKTTKEKAFNVLESSKGYIEYVEKHGKHFTDVLADHVSKKMINADGSDHRWTPLTLKRDCKEANITLPEDSLANWGDMLYLANMYYSDFCPKLIKTHRDCLVAAHAIATDPDGYDGIAFVRWTADVIAKGLDIDWEEYI